MANMITEKLRKLGLSEKETKLYMALFEIGSGVVTSIAKRAGINRSTAYVLLESLSRRGLVSVSERSGVQTFSPAPGKLVEIAEAQLKDAAELLKTGKELVSDFEKVPLSQKAEGKIRVNVFNGIEGAKLVRKGIESTKEIVRAYVTEFDSTEKNNVKSQIIVPDTAEIREKLRHSNTMHGQELFLVPEIESSHNLSVYGNKVVFLSPTENASFIIESSQFAKAISMIYDLALGKARRWNVKPEEKKTSGARKDPVLVKAEKRFWGNK